ncbi:VOC family protein [Brachybacterium hainanense]|uniref:VOC family protein n=1 Tax=Brachybacterium hainanense TaxID=1541174 RepID=A0ABV6RJC5_9MICO
MTETFRLLQVTVDARNPHRLAAFWSQATGAPVTEELGDGYVVIGTEPPLAFQQVEDPTPGKNRLHLDGTGGDRAEQVARLVELGAVEKDTVDMGSFSWTVLEDPEGNAFCVVSEGAH